MVFSKFVGIYFTFEEISYEIKRLITSGLFFVIAYFLHKQFSFREFKKVGVAFYLTKSLKLKKFINQLKIIQILFMLISLIKAFQKVK